jgi:predicted alpha/beta superfamily hydrolase
MMRRDAIRAVALLALAALAHSAEARRVPPAVPAVKPAEIWYTEQFVVHSRAAGRDYLIQVAKPFLDKGAKAPVIYVLDGNLAFGVAEGIMGPDGAVGSMQPAFIVGVGYPGISKADWLTRRNADLLFDPVTSDGITAGGEGAKFKRFLTEELRPLIEKRYGADPHKAILAGQSFGGLFAAHVLLNDPKAFDGYVIGSPSVWAEPGLLEKAAAFSAPAKVPVFIGVGAEEAHQWDDEFHMVSNTEALASKLSDHAANIDMKLWIVPDENHFTVAVPFFERGFRFVLPPVVEQPKNK